MPLTQTQQSTFQAWMMKHNPTYSCPICNRRNFGTGEIIAPPRFENGNINMGGSIVPMLQVICNNCAHVTLFATVPMGI